MLAQVGGVVGGIYTTQSHIHYVKETLLVYVLELHFCGEITTRQRPSALILTGLHPFLLFILFAVYMTGLFTITDLDQQSEHFLVDFSLGFTDSSYLCISLCPKKIDYLCGLI